MAEGKAGLFSKVVQKHAGRAKERLLQNLGKADKTTDEIFDEYVSNFHKQQNLAIRLQKEIRNYTTCLKAMQIASKSMMDIVGEMYEPEWINSDQLPVKCQMLETLWEDYCQKLNDDVAVPLNSYLNQFPDIRTKIAKRGRKLVDYDGCRHNVGSLLQNTKKRDEVKLAKAKEQLEETRELYEVISRELHEELPALYDSRISFLVSSLQTLFTAEVEFHTGNCKVFSQLTDLMDLLAAENEKETYSTRKHDSSYSFQHDSIEEKAVKTTSNGAVNGEANIVISETNSNSLKEEKVPDHLPAVSKEIKVENTNIKSIEVDKNEHSEIEMDTKPKDNISNSEKTKVEELYDIPVNATTTDLPSGTLYRVRATYKYCAEDGDEISFDIGEIMHVVEYEDPEEQEEGWLMGFKESTGQKGLFPANFTKPI